MYDALPKTGSDTGAATLQCALCIVGTGISGLNALFAATEYLAKSDRIILVDRNPRCGGMWNATYDFARLHQPHRMFTVGNLPWRWNKPDHYLATRAELQDHFSHCLDAIRARTNLLELYNHEFLHADEVKTDTGAVNMVHCQSLDGHHPPVTVRADRLIDATALNVPVPAALPLSSSAVVSTSPEQLQSEGHFDSTAPLYIVGGGKTGMDTILTCLHRNPDRPITLLNGTGTVFANRNLFLPNGIRRWWQGQLLMQTFADLAMRFDGRNQEEVFAYFRTRYAISPDGTGEQFFFGLMSRAENATIAAGLTATLKDYLTDVQDTATGPHIVLRSGARLPVAPGSVFVNCTGHLLRQDMADSRCLSPHGTRLTISTRSAIHFLPSVASYFLTHLFFRNQLRDSALYVADMHALFHQDRKLWQMTAVTQSFFNAIVLLDTLPASIINRCGLDVDRWYPMPRRLAGLIRIRLNQRRYLAHCRRSLDRVHTEHGVRCNPINLEESA